MAISLRQLRYFVALVEHRNFGRAADAVHVSQPALSVQIKDLEGALGGPLVERHARDVVPTPFGRDALDYARAILDQVQALEQAARWRGGLAGKVRLGLIPTVAPYILPQALAALRARDVSLEVQVQEAPTDRLLKSLATGDVDAAVLALPIEGNGLVAKFLFEEAFLLAGTPMMVDQLKADPGLHPDTIEPRQLLLLEEGHCLSDQALAVCGHKAAQRRMDMTASSLPTLAGLVAAGFGLTLLPEIALIQLMDAAPGLALRRFTNPEPGRKLALVRRYGIVDASWFDELATLLSAAVQPVLADARRDFP